MDLSELEKWQENNRLEAKRARGGLPHSMWETISAFANTAGGLILLGVNERENHTFEVAGLSDADKMLDDFWSAANSKNKLSARFLTDENAWIDKIGDKKVICIDVPRADRHVRPVYLDNDILSKTFRRTHTGDHRCSREEVQSLLRDAAIASQDSKVIEKARIEELDFETIERYRNEYRVWHGSSDWNKMNNTEFLDAIGAAGTGEDGELHPTGAGLLMFGKDRRITDEFPHYFLDYRQEAGAINRWVDRFTSQPGDWSGNVYDFYGKVYNKLKATLKVPFSLDANMRRVDETPAHKALREAIANCLTNANYYERRGIVCVWRDNAITIENLGDFRIPIEEAKKPGASDPRNETMLKIFAFVNVGERAGSGIETIIDGWKAGGYDNPTYEETYGPDRTTLTLPLSASEFEIGSSTVSDKLSKNESMAVELARKNGRVTTRELSAAIDRSERTAGTILKGLAKRRVIVWHGKSTRDPSQYYTLP